MIFLFNKKLSKLFFYANDRRVGETNESYD